MSERGMRDHQTTEGRAVGKGRTDPDHKQGALETVKS
jgi:hypothetical protein